MNDEQLIKLLVKTMYDGGLKQVGKDAEDTNKKVTSLDKRLSTIGKGVGIAAFTKIVSDATSKIVELTKKSSDYIETLNLLDAAFDNNTEGIKKFANSFAETLNLDDKTLLDAAAHFKVLSQSMGIATETGEEFSKLLTQMTLDVSSLYNLDFSKAQTALQYAVEGRGTSLKQRTGVSVLETSVQTTLDTLGVDAYVKDMNDAEKAIARLISMEYQLRSSQGDLARTIEAPANQFRVLGEQIALVGRNIGNILLPMMAQILPYVNAVLIVINKLLSSLAKLVGYDPAAFDYFADTDAIDYFEDLGGAVGGVGTAADSTRKKLLGLRGFDQLNVIKTPSDSPRGGGGGGGSGAGGINPKLLEAFDKMFAGYDSMLDGVKTKASQIAEKILDWLGYTDGTYKNLKKIKTLLAGGIGLGIGTGIVTKIAEVITGEKGLSAIFGSAGLAGKIGLSGGQLGGIFAKAFFDVTNYFYQWDTISSKLKKGMGIKSFGTGLWDELKEGHYILGPLKSTIDLISKAYAYYTVLRKPVSQVATVARLVNSAIQGSKVETEQLSETTQEAFDRIIGAWDEANSYMEFFKLLPRQIGKEWHDNFSGAESFTIINDETIERAKQSVDKLTTVLRDEISNRTKSESEFINNQIINNVFSEEEGKKILEKIENHGKEQQEEVEKAQKRINEIYDEAQKNGGKLTEANLTELTVLYKTLEGQTVDIVTENANEQQLIREKLKGRSETLSKEMASSIIKDAIKTRDKGIKAAEEQYEGTVREAQRMRDVGDISEKEYNKIVQGAENTRRDAVKQANLQYEETYNAFASQNEDIASYIDHDTGKVKSSWTVFWDGVYDKWKGFEEKLWTGVGDLWSGIKKGFEKTWTHIKDWWNKNVAKYFTKDYWQKKLSETFENLSVKIKTPHITWTKGASATGWIKKALEALDLPTSLPKLNVQWYAQGGLPNMGQLFVANERGPELVGQIGGQSFVANQNQMMDLLDKKLANAGGMSNATFVIQVGDETIAKKVLNDLNSMAKNDGKPIVIRGN